MRKLAIVTGFVTAALGPAGCGDDGGGAPTPDASDVPAATGVDILFVVDGTGDMAEEQTALAAAFPDFLEALAEAHGSLPDLHIAIASMDVGVGPSPWGEGCSGPGDDGLFQTCPGIEGFYLEDVSDGAGGRVTNYEGTLEEAFACASALGITGCAIEQPLESMRRALDGTRPEQASFLREDAALAVVIVTTEDDCSTEDPALFDTSQDTIDSPLGPRTSFRCFEFGVSCAEDDPRALGPRTDCVPAPDSPYLYELDEYVDFLTSLKPREHLAVSLVGGPPTPVEVVMSSGDPADPALGPSCSGTHGTAAPAVRLHAFVDAFGDTGSSATSCDPFAGALAALAADIALMLE